MHTLIVDELHALAPTKRGAHLALSLERLAALCAADPQRIGLSATVRPLDEAAGFLGGDRPVEIVDAAEPPRLDLQVRVPVPDMERVPPPPAPLGEPRRGAPRADPAAPERGLWAAVYPALLAEVRASRSTIIFVNSRGLCERLCQRLNDLAGEELLRAHHGSVAPARRAAIEEALKAGQLRGIVATSSLELGIDMGAVDCVLLVESPGSVARGLQRVGRAGHGVGEVSVGRIYPKFRGDLLECAVVARRMRTGEIEALRLPRNPLDVLAQQLVAMVADAPRTPAQLLALVRRARPYAALSRTALVGVLEMLSGAYASGDFAELRPLLSWDRARDLLSARRGAGLVARLNAGTIPDRGSYAVTLGPGGPRLGELDEEMVFETRPGDLVLLGASTWRVEQITRDRVLVTPAPGEPGRLPFWRGDGPGRPLELGRALGALVRELGDLPAARAVARLTQDGLLDAFAARNLVAYLQEQRAHTGTLPTDRSITVERFRDELGDWRVCLLTPFGARLHAPWALALQRRLARRAGVEVQLMYTDDGIVLRLADVEDLPALGELLPDPDEIEGLVTEQLPATALFAGLFRENAARALLLPKRSGGGRQPLWAQRLKAQALLATVQSYPSFPIVLETYRQALTEVFDLPGLKTLLGDILARRVQVIEVETPSASPFARSLVFAYVAAYLYEQDTPLAERKAQALTLDRELLAELLGQAELRELIDPAVLAGLEAALQHLPADRRARDPDELHDLLRRLGDLSAAELATRCAGPAAPWCAALQTEQRAVPIRLAGETRWIAAEDAGLYRDGCGVVPPPGLPEACLAPVAQALPAVLRRYARTHGPFVTDQPAARYALRPVQLELLLQRLAAEGVLVRGEIRPGGAQLDWCDAEVLRRLRRGTLAALRHQVAPVDAATLARFLAEWHGIGTARSGPERLLEAVTQLEGLALPWSALGQVLLPLRVPGFRMEGLDLLAASGTVVWVGQGALGPRDGRVCLYRRRQAAALLPVPDAGYTPGPLHLVLLERLACGACFLLELEDAARAAQAELRSQAFREVLWDLVWAGLITNDSFAPLRALTGPRRRGAETLAGGRWSLVADLRRVGATPTEQALARTQALLQRYGLLSREMARAEGVGGGFGALYPVLKGLEETGRVRRGYFVEGLAGAQFAQPGAVERLRALRLEEPPLDGFGSGDVQLLAALDPR